MFSSTALVNTPSMGSPDFPGNTKDTKGQTISMTGTPIRVSVWKCYQCGHSIKKSPFEKISWKPRG